MRSERGVTLLEIMIASAIAAVIAIGLSTIEGSRARITEQIRRQAELANPERKNAALAAVHIAKALETTDRFVLDSSSGDYLIRMPVCPTTPPDPACFDSAANYQWLQYRRHPPSRALRLYRFARPPAGCPAFQVLAGEIQGLTLQNIPAGSNVVHYEVRWAQPPRDQVFQGDVVTRFRPEAGVPLGLQNPALPEVSPPPAACP